MERRGTFGGSPNGKPYTLRNPVPIRTKADVTTTRAGIPNEPTIQVAGPVDHDSLAKAIRRSVGHDGMRPEDSRAIAAHVLNFFGFNERIIDNVLEPDDRDTFYMLEDTGILETERDETTLYDGREWRIHYWMFRKDRIFDLAREETQAMAEAGEKDIVYSSNAARSGGFRLPHGESGTGLAAHAVYHELGDEVWLERRRSPSAPPAGPTPKGRHRIVEPGV
ncbi:MAG TPA: DUF6015 family protein [Thermoplasmata archaeon]